MVGCVTQFSSGTLNLYDTVSENVIYVITWTLSLLRIHCYNYNVVSHQEKDRFSVIPIISEYLKDLLYIYTINYTQ